MASELEILARCERWQLFGSGTWSTPIEPSRNHQRKIMHAYLYECCNLFSIPFRRFVWATRHETGEMFGREHYHWLIGGVDFKASPSNCFQLNQLWDSFPKAGYSRHYLYDNSQSGVSYITKCLSAESALRDSIGAQVYEVRKFTPKSSPWGESEVTLSDALLRLVGGRRIRSTERIWRSRGTKRQSTQGGLLGEYSDRARLWAQTL